MTAPIRVLIVDDSSLFSEAVTRVLSEDSGLQVVGVATDGRMAVDLALRLRPNVITMDIQMPVMDGLTAIERIMASAPTPILVLTADPRGVSGDLSFEALRRGALDLVHKPVLVGNSVEGKLLRERVRFLASIPVVRHVAGNFGGARERERTDVGDSEAAQPRMVGIVASTGGPAALARIFEELPADFPAPIAVVQHMAPGFVGGLVSWLQRSCPLQVVVAEQGLILKAGMIAFAPDQAHLKIGFGARCNLVDTPAVGGHRPSGNVLLQSIATTWRRRAVGVVLTGMGDDGVDGLTELRNGGGWTGAQDEATSVVYGMPKAARQAGAAQEILPVDRVAHALNRVVRR